MDWTELIQIAFTVIGVGACLCAVIFGGVALWTDIWERRAARALVQDVHKAIERARMEDGR